MLQALFYAGMTLPSALIAFCVVWWRQRAHLPSSLGIGRLVGFAAVVWGSCFIAFGFLMIGTAVSGFSNLASLEGAYNLLSGIAGYLAGNILIDRMLRKKASPLVSARDVA